MKKKILFTISIVFIIVLSSCGIRPYEKNEDGKLTVATTIFPYYDFARAVGRDLINVELIIPAGRDSHSFEPTPADMIAIEQADLFLYNGGEMERWLDELLETARENGKENLRMMDYVRTDKEQVLEGMLIRGAEEDDEFDEHIWTSPRNAMRLLREISKKLQEMDPAHAAQFEENTQAYIVQLQHLDAQFTSIVVEAPKKLMIFGDKFPFYYFARDYGITCYAAFPGCSTETEPSASTMAYLIDKTVQEQVGAIYYLELSTHKVADAIGEAIGVKSLLFHSCHNVTREEFDSGVTYVQLMNQNAQNLREGLNR
ncbi:MAG: metal ABC transporter solute-binding protein, Zn/Mn family [Candidatus Fimimorpha sp.]